MPCLSAFNPPSRKTRNPILGVQIMKKCHSAYNLGSLKVKFNIQFSSTNQKLQSPHEQSDHQILRKFSCPSFQTGTSIVAILDSLAKLVLSRILPFSERARTFWYRHYRRLSWHTLYLRVARTLAYSPAFSMLLTLRLVHLVAGFIWFTRFLFSPREQQTFVSHRTVICKRYVLAMTDVT